MSHIDETLKAAFVMVVLFVTAGFGALYITGGIGDGIGLFQQADEDGEAAGEDATDAPATDLFDDDNDSGAEEAIEIAVRAGALSPCGPEAARTFCPLDAVTRAEFAVALDTALDPPDAQGSFDDVPPSATYAGAVARLAAAGVISGCGQNRFCPDDSVTRAQAAALVSRTLDLAAEPVASFDDVPAGSTFAQVIGRMAAQGFMQGCQDQPPEFCPDDPLARESAASLLVAADLVS